MSAGPRAAPARVLAVGAAAPALRLPVGEVHAAWGRATPRGAPRVGVAAPDEDTLTLAAEAAARALVAAAVDPGDVDGLWWGTTRPPFAEGPSHALLAAALGLGDRSTGSLTAGSPHAGMEALLAAADAVAAGSARVAVVVASDALAPGLGTSFEARAGAGAAALVLGADDGPAALTARVTRTRPFLDRYRGDGEHATRDLYDARLFRDEVFLPMVHAVTEHLAAFEVSAWSLPDPDGRTGASLARGLGAPTPVSASVYGQLGDTGAAAGLLGGLGALDATGIVALVGAGGGRVTGVTLTVDTPVPGAAGIADVLDAGVPVGYTEALRARGQLVAAGETIPMGVPPESAAFVRGADEMLGLLGARCADCGTISTPPTIHPTCIGCGGTKLDVVPLDRHGAVHTFVVNQTMPAPFVAPLPIAVVDLDDGARVMLQVTGDGTGLRIGARVELVLRRYAHERGAPVYGWKSRVVEVSV